MPTTSSMEKISIASSRRASGTMRYSNRFCSIRIGSAVCSNRLTTGVQPSRNVLLRNAQFQHLAAVAALEIGKEKQELDLLAEIGGGELFEAGQIQEEELLGKREVFLQQPVAPETAARKRAAALRPAGSPPGAETRRQHHALLRRSRQVARHDLEAVVAQQFDEAVRDTVPSPCTKKRSVFRSSLAKLTSGRQCSSRRITAAAPPLATGG